MAHPKNPGYIAGNYWVVCDVCGFEYRQSVMKRRWDNLIVCPEDYEVRHPQDFIRARGDDSAARGLVRTVPEPIYIEACPINGRIAKAGVGVAGCAIAGRDGVEQTVPSGTFTL